jgi:signal transduction histidine kinase
MLKMLDNASRIYLELIKPVQSEIIPLDVISFQDRIENIFYAQNTNSEIRFLIAFDQALPNVIVDINSISLALREIFMNACEAIQGEGRVRVKLEYDEKQNVFILSIANNGRPIAENIRYEMFNPYITDKQGHSGLGLTRARIAVQRLGGDVHLLSTDEENTEFRITIPALIKISN